MFIGVYNRSVILTYLGLAFSVIGMYFAFAKNMDFSIICLILAGVCDLFDGVVARRCKRTDMEKEFGVQIDSLVDVISFGVFPIIIFINLELTSIYSIFVLILYVICAVSRLAYFNTHANKEAPVKFYTGLPVTTAALIFPLFYLLHDLIPNLLFGRVYTTLMLFVALLFILNIKLPKASFKICICFAFLAIVVIGVIIMF